MKLGEKTILVLCLTRKLTVAQAEAEHTSRDDGSGRTPVPFGIGNRHWKEMLALMREGDELWKFSSCPASWEGRCGRAGLTLLRNGKELACVFTAMS